MTHDEIVKGTAGIIRRWSKGYGKWWDADELAQKITNRGFPITGHRLAMFLAKEGVKKRAAVSWWEDGGEGKSVYPRSYGSKWLLDLIPIEKKGTQ